MNQTLKISIARGGCRFATPLYLGGSYELSFAGERADEADCVLFTKPRSRNPNKEVGIDALAISVRELPNENPVLNLNKKVLLDWFKDCGCCEVDATVDAHCYVFNASGEVIADSDVCIEYTPVDFVVDTDGFAKWDELRIRIVALEEQALDAQAKFEAQTEKNASLDETDAQNLIAAASDATRKANETLDAAKSYADAIMNMVAKIQYVKCDAESTTENQVYHRVVITKNEHGAHTLAIDETPVSIEGGDPETTRYVYTDTNQQISGNKTFTGDVKVKTASADSNDTTAANTAWVNSEFVSKLTLFLSGLLSTKNTWTAKQTFSGGIEGNLTGDVAGNITGDVTGNLTGDVEGNVDATTLDVTGAETHGGAETHAGAETHTGDETHSGTFDATNVVTKQAGISFANQFAVGIANEKFVWDMMKMMSKFFDGSWRIVNDNVNLNPTHAVNQQLWKTHSQQKNLISFMAESVYDYGCYSPEYLYYVYLPNVSTIGNYAFYDADELGTIDAQKVVTIGDYAFASSAVLANLMIQSVESIGNHAFESCPKITILNLPNCHTIGEDCFRGSNLISSIDIGSSLDSRSDFGSLNTSIGANAFYDNDTLEHVNVKNMKTIGHHAFYSCQNIGSLNIENCVTIDDYAFMDAGRTKGGAGVRIQINIPNCTFVGSHAFGYYLSGTSTSRNEVYGGVINAQSLTHVRDFGFARLIHITGMKAPLLQKIDNNAFYDCAELAGADTMEFDGATVQCQRFDSALEIGDQAFQECASLRHLVIPNVQKMGYHVFLNCPNLAAPNNVHIHITGKTCYEVLSMGNGATSSDANIANWAMGSNWRVHCSDGTIAYVNGSWQQV